MTYWHSYGKSSSWPRVRPRVFSPGGFSCPGCVKGSQLQTQPEHSRQPAGTAGSAKWLQQRGCWWELAGNSSEMLFGTVSSQGLIQ